MVKFMSDESDYLAGEYPRWPLVHQQWHRPSDVKIKVNQSYKNKLAPAEHRIFISSYTYILLRNQ